MILIKKSKGYFYKLVKESGKEFEDKIKKLAEDKNLNLEWDLCFNIFIIQKLCKIQTFYILNTEVYI